MAFNVVTISGSLRKRSFNTALMRSLPALATADLDLSEAPPYDRMPLPISSPSAFPPTSSPSRMRSGTRTA